jgi:SHAQKYF class myb-like DNA-binding protein
MMVDCFDLDDTDTGSRKDKDKESTGRWTREEHLAFIKGLELHGKGWKKIASLIKTRTVVQIRTHAQKYFLKLSKARQNGDTSLSADGRGHGSTRRKKSRQRYCDKPIAVAPTLLPFLKEGSTVENAMEINDGIYNFLSPAILLPKPEATSSSSILLGEIPPSYSQVEKPSWFLKGQNVATLLQEAEECNWLQDSGHSVYSLNNPFNKPLTAPMSTSPRETATASPREIPTATSTIPSTVSTQSNKNPNRSKSNLTKKQQQLLNQQQNMFSPFPFNNVYPSFENFDTLVHSGEDFGWGEEKVGFQSENSYENLKKLQFVDDFYNKDDLKDSFKEVPLCGDKWMM